MITSFFFKLATYFLLMIGNVPQWEAAVNFTEAIEEAIGYTLILDGILPVRTFWIAVFSIMGFEMTLWLVNSSISFFNWIRGSGELKIGSKEIS